MELGAPFAPFSSVPIENSKAKQHISLDLLKEVKLYYCAFTVN